MRCTVLKAFSASGVLSLILISALGCQAQPKVASLPPAATQPPATVQPPVEDKAPPPSIHKIWQDTDEEVVKDGMTYHITMQRDLRSEGTATDCVKLVANPQQDPSRSVEFIIKLAGGYTLKDDHFTSYKGEVTNSSITILGVPKQLSELSDPEKAAFDSVKEGINSTVDFHIDKLTDDTLVLSDNNKHTYLYRAVDESQLLLK